MGRPYHPEYIDVPRICYACGSTKTRSNKHGSPNWCFNQGTKLMLCLGCWKKYVWAPGYRSQIKRHIIRYFGKQIRYNWLMRTGYCSQCPNNVHDGTCNATHFHHRYYLVICPWFGIQELCSKCHIETWLNEASKHWAKKRQAHGLKETWRARKWREKKMYPLVPM
jgi:hypothetical protein